MEIKGTAVLAIRDFVKNNFKDNYDSWVASLPADSKSIFSTSIDSTTWYPVAVGAVEPTTAIGIMFYANDIKKGAWESGRYSAKKALTGIYKIFVKASSPGFIISRAKDLFARYYRPCEIRVLKNENKTVLLKLTDLNVQDQLVEYRIGGWMEQALEINGCSDVTVNIKKVEDENGPHTLFDIHWK